MSEDYSAILACTVSENMAPSLQLAYIGLGSMVTVGLMAFVTSMEITCAYLPTGNGQEYRAHGKARHAYSHP